MNESQSRAQSLSAEQREREGHCAQVFSWPACNNTKAFVRDNSSKCICLQRFFTLTNSLNATSKFVWIGHISACGEYLTPSKVKTNVTRRPYIVLFPLSLYEISIKTITYFLRNIIVMLIIIQCWIIIVNIKWF